MTELLTIYRERNGDPSFWAEPCNAVSNISFLIAAALAYRLAAQKDAATPLTLALILMVGTVGIGSFLFHTAVGPITLWLDVIPIAVFQVVFLWLAFHRIVGLRVIWSSAIVAGVLIGSLALMPIEQPLNGSLFYLPSWAALVTVGLMAASANQLREPYLLSAAACCFTLAIAARASDWIVPWHVGSHFLWHLINGGVVYLGLRSWIVEVAGPDKTRTLGIPAEPARQSLPMRSG